MANAWLRGLPGAYVVAINAIAVGAAAAADIPCRVRPTIRLVWSHASPHSNEVSVNTVTPVANTRLRPKLSPSRPPSNIRPPNASTYAVMIQLPADSVSPSASRIFGSASATTVPSSTTSSCNPPSTKIGTPHTRRCPPPVPAPQEVMPSDATGHRARSYRCRAVAELISIDRVALFPSPTRRSGRRPRRTAQAGADG